MRAAIYARYSSDMQSETSIADQLHVCRKLLAKHGWTETRTFSDSAISGATNVRPGLQDLLQAAAHGVFDVLVSESLDRLSRDQGYIVTIYQHLNFRKVPIVTVAEGDISEIHIGFKGTMSALYLKDLAQKTRRGLEGRVHAGKSGGGNAYGYRVVTGQDADGTPVTGEREIDLAEAEVVRRIFQDYVAGKSSRTIAGELNAEGVAGPRGEDWGMSTIHGNPKRGTGILNNQLYIGKLVWNRQCFVRDPNTGKRQSRLNPPEEWIIEDVPHLRIIEDGVWDAVKIRQEERRHDMRAADGSQHLERARRPRHLFSGLLTCGCCGASYILVGKTRYGCAAARNKGTCDNRRTIEREEVETRVLDGLKDHLLHPDLIAEFVDEYRREYVRLMKADRTRRRHLEKDLAQVRRKIERIIDAIAEGFRNDSMKSTLDDLETRQAALKAEIAELGDEEPVLLHPGLSDIYRAKVADLTAALNHPDTRQEAAELIRGLLGEIRMIPEAKGHAIELVGELASLLALGEARTTKPRGMVPGARSITVVAGACNQRYLRLVEQQIPKLAA